jgi:hypothetical protein
MWPVREFLCSNLRWLYFEFFRSFYTGSALKKKAKFSLCLANETLRHEVIWGNEFVDHILTSALLDDKWSVLPHLAFYYSKLEHSLQIR